KRNSPRLRFRANFPHFQPNRSLMDPEPNHMDISMPQSFVKMVGFERKSLDIAGVETVVYTIGSGPPLVFLHGAGTFTGFETVRSWAANRTVIVPYHPGFGESGDDPTA